jgi:hypothetical protein
MKNVKSILVPLFLSFSLLTMAQQTCTEKLYNANELYEQGNIKEAISLASTCTDSDVETERWQAYHLLALAYIANNEQTEAKRVTKKMLEINPTYKPSSIKDPAELVRIINSIKVIPKLSLGLAATVGGKITFPRVENTYNGSQYTKTYESKASWQVGMIAGYNMNEFISLNSGLVATNKRFGISYDIEGNNFEFDERLNYLDVPVFARFSSVELIDNFKIFADAGIYGGYLMSSSTNIIRTIPGVDDEGITINNLDSKSRFNAMEYGAIFGGGLMYELGQVNLALDAKYYAPAFYNLTNEEKRYKQEDLFYKYFYLGDDLRLSNFAVSFSLLYNINYRVL